MEAEHKTNIEFFGSLAESFPSLYKLVSFLNPEHHGESIVNTRQNVLHISTYLIF